ncbi:MAG TPA: hypothetical protein VMT15_07845 [Bryobacteraceae bacterium]|nr:hypothetical protein [Bryobacteraceae bacterium]
MIRIAVGLILACAAFYAGDFAVAKSRPLGSVQVQPYYAIHQKNGKTEFDYGVPPEMQGCVASVLPHFGFTPCWYLKGHRSKRIEI